MNFVFLPISKRWINLDYLVSIDLNHDSDGDIAVYSSCDDGSRHCYYTKPEDAQVIFDRLQKLEERFNAS